MRAGRDCATRSQTSDAPPVNTTKPIAAGNPNAMSNVIISSQAALRSVVFGASVIGLSPIFPLALHFQEASEHSCRKISSASAAEQVLDKPKLSPERHQYRALGSFPILPSVPASPAIVSVDIVPEWAPPTGFGSWRRWRIPAIQVAAIGSGGFRLVAHRARPSGMRPHSSRSNSNSPCCLSINSAISSKRSAGCT